MDSTSVTSSQELYGAGVASDMVSTSGYRAPVGWLSVGCSATALAPDTVLTAAHCLCNWVTGQWIPASGMSFFLPQAGGANPKVASYQLHPNALCVKTGDVPLLGPPDLAVLALATPIPLNVLQDFPRLHLGPTKADWESGVLEDHTASFASGAFSVGWGGTVHYNSAAGAGTTRRYGPVAPSPERDPCDKLTAPVNLEGPCNDYYQWEDITDAVVGAVPAKGDSGSPLYLTDTVSGELVVAGVYSGWYQAEVPLSANPSKPRQVWAPTGNIGKIGNHTFLIKALGGDTDKDGVPDAVDNCPFKSNPDQVDDDGDNVGDDCDNCAPASCAALAQHPGVTCTNPSQLDGDNDGAGDTCDLCPEVGNGSKTQSDDDGDGVGNDCDTCAKPNGYASCVVAGATCPKNAGFCVVDQGAGPFAFGRCSRVVDDDNDGTPTACDTCNFSNASSLNSNDLAEERERLTNSSIAVLGDDCDPVPVVRIPVQKPVTMDIVAYSNLSTSDGVGPDEVVDIPQERWLGKQTATEPVAQGPSQALGFRQCNCFGFDGTPLPVKGCVAPSSQCSWDAPMLNSLWTIPSLTLTNDIPILNATGVTVLPGTFTRGAAQAMTLRWRWRDDLKNGKVTGQGPCGASVESCKAHIALFTTTQGAPASPRDASAALRDVFQTISAPAIKVYIPKPDAILPSQCQAIPCLEWYNPKLYLLDPALEHFSEGFTSPVLLTKAGGAIAALLQPAGAYDVTSAISPGVAALIGDTPQMWLTPSEPAYRVRRTAQRGGVQAVAFPRDLTATSSIDVVRGTPAGLTGGRRTDVIEASVAEPAALRPRDRTDVRAVLSGVEEAVYMVGGRATSGNASQALWRFTLADQAWRIVAEHAAVVPSSQVLAVTYDQPSGKLYVLDLDDEVQPKGKLRLARLTSYDVRAGTAQQLAAWPYFALFDQLWLSTTDDGSLLLIAAKQQVHSVWRLQPKPAGLAYAGLHLGLGRLLGQPVMGEHDPVIAVRKATGKLEYRTLTPSLFVGHTPCSSL